MSRWFLAKLPVACIIFDTGLTSRKRMSAFGKGIHERSRYCHRHLRHPRPIQVILQYQWKSHPWTLKPRTCLQTAVVYDSSHQCSQGIEVPRPHRPKKRGIGPNYWTADSLTMDYPSTGKEWPSLFLNRPPISQKIKSRPLQTRRPCNGIHLGGIC